MELQPKHVVLTVKNVDKPDEGPYKVTMQNEFGKDDAQIKTEVTGTRVFPVIHKVGNVGIFFQRKYIGNTWKFNQF